ncbi:MAG: alpha/beta hydrolase [Planctomycetia bacterium]|nr:alpha/beta hydrolase [Planctomycetia bacterium]
MDWLRSSARGGLWVAALAAALLPAVPVTGRAQEAGATAAAAERVPTPLWYGEMEAADRQFRFVVEALPGPDGTPGHQLRSIDEGDRRFPLSDVVDDGERLSFILAPTAAAYSGTVADGTATGTWRQRGAELALVFRRVGEGPVPPTPDEVWTGTLNAVVQKLVLQFRVTNGAGGRRRVRMDSITQEVGGFRADLSIDGQRHSIKVPAVRGEFSGELSADGTTLTGTWKQAGASLPLVLTKGAAATVPPAKRRPQTPRPPFPYTAAPVTFPNETDGIDLAGTLTLPSGAGPFPALVLVSGSGPQDRDETLFDHKPFAVLADHLTRAGFAVLRYDDRGVGASAGDGESATTADLARDALAAARFLAADPRIDAARIGLVGHSEGAAIVTLVACERRETACLVLLAGAGVDGEQVLLSQGALVLRAEGLADPERLARQRTMQTILMEAVKTSPPNADAAPVIAIVAKRLKAALGADSLDGQDIDQLAASGVIRLSSRWFRHFLVHDPAADLARVGCPVLALFGEKDVQVDPALNRPPVEQALAKAALADSAVETLPGLNHLFQTCTTGAVSEYDTIEETLAPAVLDRVTAWLTDRLDPPSPAPSQGATP